MYRGHDQIYMLTDMLRNAVFVTGNVLVPGGVSVDFILGLEKAFDFADVGFEVQPAFAVRQADPRLVDTR